MTARIRDAVRRVGEVLLELESHLDRNLITGLQCRYRGDQRWDVEL